MPARDLRIGTFAEYIAINQNDVAPKSLTFHEAAAVPLVALTASQILVETAQVKPGQKVLVRRRRRAGSRVSQLAKRLGAHVAKPARRRGTCPRPRSRRCRRLHQDRTSPRSCPATTSWWTRSAARSLMRSLTVLKPGVSAIGVAGPPDAGFAEQLGAPKPFDSCCPFLSRKVRRAARKLGVGYSFFFMRPVVRSSKARGPVRSGRLRPILDSTFAVDQTLVSPTSRAAESRPGRSSSHSTDVVRQPARHSTTPTKASSHERVQTTATSRSKTAERS